MIKNKKNKINLSFKLLIFFRFMITNKKTYQNKFNKSKYNYPSK